MTPRTIRPIGTRAPGTARAPNPWGSPVPSIRTRLKEILEGQIPDGSGRRLGRKGKDGSLQHCPGRDVTLSAPKLVSLAALIGGDERIVAAHDGAVKHTLAWIEKNVLQTRLRDPATGRMVRAGGHKMIAATFRHDTSRNRARALLDTRGYELKGLAPSASAAQTLAAGAHIETETLQRFLARNASVGEGRLTRKGARDMRAAFKKPCSSSTKGRSPPRSRPAISSGSHGNCGCRGLAEALTAGTKKHRTYGAEPCAARNDQRARA